MDGTSPFNCGIRRAKRGAVIPVVTGRHLVAFYRFRSIAKSYFRRCDGVILMYDVNYERSFLNVRNWIDTIHESTAKRVSLMMVANKIDLRDQSRLNGRRVVEYAEGVRRCVLLYRDMQCNEDLERFRTTSIDLDKGAAKKSTCCAF
jgi:GTPase SAR1 family protein